MNATLYTADRSASQRPLPTPKPIRNPFTRLFLWASKTDPRLAALATPWARATQAAFGVFVFFTALLAFGGMYYTLSTLAVPAAWVLWIALGWGIFVFFLDREIVGGLDRAAAIVRPLLALALGTIVAVQIQLFVFQNRIDQELARQYRQDNREQFEQIRTAQADLEKRRADLQATLADLRKQEAEWGRVMDDELTGQVKAGRTGMSGPGPVFKNADAQQAATRQRIQEVRRDLDAFELSLPEERERLERQFQRQEIAKTTDFVTRYEALHRVIHNSTPLYWMSWFITLTLILIEATPSILRILTPRSDYDHLVYAEMRENMTRIDELSEQNYRLAMENPETPELTVPEKFAAVQYTIIGQSRK